jgi:hypothetical protein
MAGDWRLSSHAGYLGYVPGSGAKLLQVEEDSIVLLLRPGLDVSSPLEDTSSPVKRIYLCQA